MRIIKIIYLLVFISFYYSCSDENNPVLPIEANTLFGNIGTERVYKETTNWFDPVSNYPYYSVPDSLLSRVSLNHSQLQQGICEIRNFTEQISQIDDDYYNDYNLTYPKTDYIQIFIQGISYKLSDELDSLILNKTYSIGNFGYRDGVYRKSSEGIMTAHLLPNNFPSVPYLKNNICINDTWIRYKFTSASGNTIIESVANVKGMEYVVVPAGTFNALKIITTTYDYNKNYDYIGSVEYYVQNIGLVLKETDALISKFDVNSGTTINVRQTTRKELISYNFVP
jgi:hypothetical protein